MHHTEDKPRFHRESSFRLRDLCNANPVRPALDNCCFFQAKTDFVYDPHALVSASDANSVSTRSTRERFALSAVFSSERRCA